jgi:hypothetical protein
MRFLHPIRIRPNDIKSQTAGWRGLIREYWATPAPARSPRRLESPSSETMSIDLSDVRSDIGKTCSSRISLVRREDPQNRIHRPDPNARAAHRHASNPGDMNYLFPGQKRLQGRESAGPIIHP